MTPSRNGRRDRLVREPLADQVPGRPRAESTALDDSPSPLGLWIEQADRVLDQLRGDPRVFQVMADQSIAGSPAGEGRGARLRKPTIVDEPGPA
jgi:hypothetical protein